jgi:hypothetical protein
MRRRNSMNLTHLVKILSHRIQNSQRSERWVIYRVIMPVLDYIEGSNPRIAHFEYNQTSLHGTNQTVDIALLEDGVPKVFLEAKRIDRHISSDKIAKYMEEGVRGLVSNGVDWILWMDERSRHIRIYDPIKNTFNHNGLKDIIAFIESPPVGIDDWTKETIHIPPIIRPVRIAKKIKAMRISKEVFSVNDCSSFAGKVANLPRASVNQTALLDAMVERFNSVGGIPVWLLCKLRTSRISFFDSNLKGSSQRIGRIEFGKKQPDILLLTSIVEKMRNKKNEMSPLESIVQSNPHDKNPNFRRFRLGNEKQSGEFGKSFVDALLIS